MTEPTDDRTNDTTANSATPPGFWRRELLPLWGLARSREGIIILTGALLVVAYELHKADLGRRLGSDLQLKWAFFAWLGSTTVLLGVIPLLVALALRLTLRDLGLGLGKPRVWAPYLLGYAVIMTPLVYLASRQPSFGSYYPQYRFGAAPGPEAARMFWLSELAFGPYWIAWEFFFRGYLILALVPRFGPAAVLIPVAAFAMTHLEKPELECWSAIVAAVALGWMSYRGRSVWPCVLLHWACGLSMDLLAKYGS